MEAGSEDVSKTIGSHLEYFAQDGLRTLCIAERVIEESVYEVRKGQFQAPSLYKDDLKMKIVM